MSTTDDAGAVLDANQAFYDAFEARDLDAMSEVWEHSDRVICTHPGWITLRGWSSVAASWMTLFQNEQRLQFILTNEFVEIVGDAAWVTLNENILDTAAASTVAAVNVFVRRPGGWQMVVHHASPVAQ